MVAWLGWGFDLINNFAAVRQRLAEHHGRRLLDIEHSLHLDPESALNSSLAGHHGFNHVVVFWYESVHGIVLFAVIGWLWWRRPELYSRLRAILVLATLAALAVFWAYPVAPPRMLAGPHLVDLVAVAHGLSPYWQPGSVSSDSNMLAALPSLHIAWALWSSLAVWRISRRRWVRAGALIYPLVTLYAILATGNHYVLDALAGAAVTALAALAVGAVGAVRSRRRGLPEPAPAPAA